MGRKTALGSVSYNNLLASDQTKQTCSIHTNLMAVHKLHKLHKKSSVQSLLLTKQLTMFAQET